MKISEIKSKLTIETVLKHYQLTLDRNNRINCPFHDDKTPSMQIYPSTNTWNCFSSNCDAGNGDVIDFVMKYDNISKHLAIKKCASLAGELPKITPPKPKESKEIIVLNRVSALSQVFLYFQAGIRTNSKQAQAYLEKRSLHPQKLEIGYNSGQFHYRENTKYIKTYEQIGLLNKNKQGNGYIPFAKHCIIFPLKNKHNEIVSFYGRSILNENKSKHFYLPQTQGLYPHYPNTYTKKLIIAECIIDTATLFQLSSIKSSYELLASYGTNRLTQEHLNAIIELTHLEEIIFFFDGDDAGKKAIEKYSQTLHAIRPKLIISYVQTPEKEDINSLYSTYDEDCILTLINERQIIFQTDQVSVTSDPITNIDTPIFDTTKQEAITYDTSSIHITVLGGIKINGLERMKVTLKIEVKSSNQKPIRHTLDLYNNNQLLQIIRIVSEQLDISTQTIQDTLLDLIEKLEQYRIDRLANQQAVKPVTTIISHKETVEAEAYLKSKDLMKNTFEDLGKTGIIGEDINRFVMYLVFLSRITKAPLHVISFGASGTGKTHLQDKIGNLLPKEDRIPITSLSTNALYYFEHHDLMGKVILIEDLDGAKDALYPLRELKSKQEINKTVSIKNPQGKARTIQVTVQSQVVIAGCTTKATLYEDNANRSILLYIDGSKEQDERIMTYQRLKSAGKIDTKQENDYQNLLRNVQTILKPIKVINPYAPQLSLPVHTPKRRRLNPIYLHFINTVTLYNQFQRKTHHHPITKEAYIETTLTDIAWANKLIKPILLRKSDELTQPTRQFFEHLKSFLKKQQLNQFKTRDIRNNLPYAISTIKRYLTELLNAGLITITGGSKARGYTYEITSYDEYQKLKTNIDYTLDSLLDKLKKEVAQ